MPGTCVCGSPLTVNVDRETGPYESCKSSQHGRAVWRFQTSKSSFPLTFKTVISSPLVAFIF
jgi:hypothetical protein